MMQALRSNYKDHMTEVVRLDRRDSDRQNLLTRAGNWNSKCSLRGSEQIIIQRYLVLFDNGPREHMIMVKSDLTDDAHVRCNIITTRMNGQDWIIKEIPEDTSCDWDYHDFEDDLCKWCHGYSEYSIENSLSYIEACSTCTEVFRNTQVCGTIAYCDETAVSGDTRLYATDDTHAWFLNTSVVLSISSAARDCYVCGYIHSDPRSYVVCGDCVYAHRMMVAHCNLASYIVIREAWMRLGCEDVFRVLMGLYIVLG